MPLYHGKKICPPCQLALLDDAQSFDIVKPDGDFFSTCLLKIPALRKNEVWSKSPLLPAPLEPRCPQAFSTPSALFALAACIVQGGETEASRTILMHLKTEKTPWLRKVEPSPQCPCPFLPPVKKRRRSGKERAHGWSTSPHRGLIAPDQRVRDHIRPLKCSFAYCSQA